MVQSLADQRQILLDHLVEAQEDERARIAADVHDDSVQALAVVELRLHVMRRANEEERPELLGSLHLLHESVRTATGPAQDASRAEASGPVQRQD